MKKTALNKKTAFALSLGILPGIAACEKYALFHSEVKSQLYTSAIDTFYIHRSDTHHYCHEF